MTCAACSDELHKIYAWLWELYARSRALPIVMNPGREPITTSVSNGLSGSYIVGALCREQSTLHLFWDFGIGVGALCREQSTAHEGCDLDRESIPAN